MSCYWLLASRSATPLSWGLLDLCTAPQGLEQVHPEPPGPCPSIAAPGCVFPRCVLQDVEPDRPSGTKQLKAGRHHLSAPTAATSQTASSTCFALCNITLSSDTLQGLLLGFAGTKALRFQRIHGTVSWASLCHPI